jgi:hypothetical protein
MQAGRSQAVRDKGRGVEGRHQLRLGTRKEGRGATKCGQGPNGRDGEQITCRPRSATPHLLSGW